MPLSEPHFGSLKRDQPFLTIYQTMHAADKVFYQSYDPLFLAKKAAVLYGIYKNHASFLACSEPWNMGSAVGKQELLTMVATELHCTSFHQTEAMIALLLAEFQDRPDWVYLTTYGNSEIKQAARAIEANEFASISSGTASSAAEFIKAAVFATWDLSKNDEAAQWEESISGLGFIIETVAKQFLTGHEYNSYKHGLRVVSGSARLGLSVDLAATKVLPMISMQHAMTYLQILKLENGYGAERVTQEIDPEYSFELIQCMAPVLSLIKTMRLARIDQTLPSELSLPIIDTALLLSKKPGSRFSMPY